MRIFSSFLLVFLSLAAIAKEKEVFRLWNVTGASTLEIEGTTNMNSFLCTSDYNKGNDRIMESLNPHSNRWEIYGTLLIDVNDFDCNNRIMNKDFREVLQYEQYPEIMIDFLNLRETNSQGKNRQAAGLVEITLAGRSKQYNIISELIFVDEYYSILKGSYTFRFSDFGLEPPQKAMGLVKVNNEITVHFNLSLEKSLLTIGN